VTDVIMPGMSGFDLAERFAALSPGTPVRCLRRTAG
jgi:FixJ family two-component response regulator